MRKRLQQSADMDDVVTKESGTILAQPVELTDAEMDEVAAGQGLGVETAYFHGSAPDFVLNQVNLVTQGDEHASVGVAPGHGTSTL